MGNIKKRLHSASFKTKVALELIRESDTLSSICSRFSIHPTQARNWKAQAMASLQSGFLGASKHDELKAKDQLIDELYKQVGQLKVELDWLKKNLTKSDKTLRGLIEPDNNKISIVRQCQLLGVNRTSYYYQPQPVSQLNLELMRKIDEIYTDMPFYGSFKMTKALKRQGYPINHKRIERLMQNMGIQAIFPKPNTSKAHPEHTKYPYLLNRVNINHPNHVWGTDITYVRALNTWFYLTVILDWYSRYVISWRLSPSLTVDFCIAALGEALKVAQPDYHNSDQGVQFTAEEYLALLKSHPEIKISMDGRGRCFDNIFTERLWRTVKYEEVYLHDYTSFDHAYDSLDKYFTKYNTRRLHQSLDYQTPAEIYLA